MASRLLSRSLPPMRQPSAFLLRRTTQSFHTSPRHLQSTAEAVPVRKPVGAFRAGIFGFLLGTVVSGGATFYWGLQEYRVSNELLTEDIYALQAAVQKINSYVATFEERVDLLEKKKK